MPNSSSSAVMAEEMEGWEIFTFSEARVMLPVSAVATK